MIEREREREKERNKNEDENIQHNTEEGTLDYHWILLLVLSIFKTVNSALAKLNLTIIINDVCAHKSSYLVAYWKQHAIYYIV
jgi:hypothetical protein